MYSFDNKINLLTEKIKISEDLISEMKKIGIEKLPYSQSSLKRFIDSKTMDVHYNGHYKTYVKKLNDALSKKNYGDVELEDIIKSISKYNQTIRNNAGGAFNHALFWKMLSPKKQEIPKEIKSKIINSFGSLDLFKKKFVETSLDRFGSGWCWLILTKKNKLKIMTTPNQDNPLMNVIKDGGFPLLGLDLWEHAYYLKYQNKRDEYVKNFWDVVNWEFVNQLYLSKLKTKLSEAINKPIKQSLNESILTEGMIISKLGVSWTTLRKIIFSVYPKCSEVDRNVEGCIGKIETSDCQTNEGIIGGNYQEKKYGYGNEWSIINKWDSNTNIHKKLEELFEKRGKDNPDYAKLNGFDWLNEKKFDLFSNNGKLTSTLADVGKETMIRGWENENYAKELISSIYRLNPEELGVRYKISTNCSGSYNDTKLGQDIELEIDNEKYFFQIKQIKKDQVKVFTDDRGPFYRINASYVHDKYKMEHVDVIVYVDIENNSYIMFRNDHDKILTIKSPNWGEKFYIYYYEEPIHTNMTFKAEPKYQSPSIEKQKELLKKTKEEQIKQYKEKIKFYQDKLKEFGVSDEIQEQIKVYRNKVINLIKG
jgi:Fe-Mn family superoxide dismutase